MAARKAVKKELVQPTQSTRKIVTGKRKTAIAKAIIKEGKGIVRINKCPLNTLPLFSRTKIEEPLVLAGDDVKKLDIIVTVKGGGWNGQADAVRLAIARALVNIDKKFKKVFQDYDKYLLIQDVRFKEARKPNDSKARASRQKSYR